jgi:dihydroorotase
VLDYPIIDIHCHLRENIPYHTQLAKEASIDTLVFMPNTYWCMDNVDTITKYMSMPHYTNIIPVSAATIERQGVRLVDIDKIKDLVIGFSDDGDCLWDMDLVDQILEKDVLFLAHLEPEYKMALKYIDVLAETGGKLHIQHVSKKKTVNLIRSAKNDGLRLTCETCPHYFTYQCDIEDKMVNPPLGYYEDVMAIRQGLSDGTIDIIASDYAPIPRPKNTGFASFYSFIALSYGLVLDGTLTEQQLKEKIYLNPKRLIEENYKGEING